MSCRPVQNLVILTDIERYVISCLITVSLSELSQLIVQIFDTFAFFEPPFGGGGLGTIDQQST